MMAKKLLFTGLLDLYISQKYDGESGDCRKNLQQRTNFFLLPTPTDNPTSLINTIQSMYELLSQKIILNVLSQTLDQLAILRHINGWSLDERTIVEYQTIEQQCTTIKNDTLPPESDDIIDLRDFRRDCAFIEDTILKTFDEISRKGTYETLQGLREVFKRLEREESELLEETERKEEKYEELQEAYYRERMVFRKKIDDMMMKIGNLKDEIEDFEQEAEIKGKYLTSWQKSKIEMNNYINEKKVQEISETIQESHHDFTKEDRVNLEVKNIYAEIGMVIPTNSFGIIFNETFQNYQKEMKKWRLKYESDMTAINKKIDNLKVKREEQQDKTAEMVKKYIKRQQEIDDYEKYKIEQEQKRKEKEEKDKAATRIQAWWRGTMVRKGFGKFKKKKDKKGKKKDDKKK